MKMGYISPLKEKRLSDSVIKVLVYLVKKKKKSHLHKETKSTPYNTINGNLYVHAKKTS